MDLATLKEVFFAEKLFERRQPFRFEISPHLSCSIRNELRRKEALTSED